MNFVLLGLAILTGLAGIVPAGRLLLLAFIPQVKVTSGSVAWFVFRYGITAAIGLSLSAWLFSITLPAILR